MSAARNMAGTDGPADTLKIRAEDAEDLEFVAACLQDALVPVADVAFLPGERRFVMVANRFRWESSENPGSAGAYERIHCGVSFEGVSRVQSRGIDLGARHQVLDLLTVTMEAGAVLLLFAGGGTIRLEIDSLHCHVRDLGLPWPTQWRPDHPGAED